MKKAKKETSAKKGKVKLAKNKHLQFSKGKAATKHVARKNMPNHDSRNGIPLISAVSTSSTLVTRGNFDDLTVVIAASKTYNNYNAIETLVKKFCGRAVIHHVLSKEDTISLCMYYHPEMLFLEDVLNVDNESGMDVSRVIFSYLPTPPMVIEFAGQKPGFETSAIGQSHHHCENEEDLLKQMNTFMEMKT